MALKDQITKIKKDKPDNTPIILAPHEYYCRKYQNYVTLWVQKREKFLEIN